VYTHTHAHLILIITAPPEALESMTLENLQADEIFIGMIAMRERPKRHTNHFVEVLREAGIRFVLFSGESRRSSNNFVGKLGLETVSEGREGRQREGGQREGRQREGRQREGRQREAAVK